MSTLEQKILAITSLESESDRKAAMPIIEEVIAKLDKGEIRVATKTADGWITHTWIKQAILHYFKLQPTVEIKHGPFVYNDKIPLKTNYRDLGVRVVPPAVARYGAFMERGVILMPSYVNIGAYVGANTMVDTWATVGSCAQIGSDCHLSGGVGIGGVLEPANATPVIVEDGCFIGSRAIIVEGVRIEKEAVIAANVTITSSTPIIDTRGAKHSEWKGHIPSRAVVVPGTKEKKVAGGVIYTQCAYIIGDRTESTDRKTSLTKVLRDYDISL